MTGMLEAFWNVSDALIALGYFSITAVLVLLVRARRDMAFGWAFWCFAVFMLACGLTHAMSIWTWYQPVYGLEAGVKLVAAVASVATAALLWPMLPKALALPSLESIQAANVELAAMIRERDAALAELRAQIAQREKAEAALLQAQKLEAVGELTGGIAHDFNNLLQAVGGNLELIARKPEDPDRVVRWSASALDAVERGRSLSGQLLAFSRRQRLELSAVRLSDLIGGMRDLMERAVAPHSALVIEPIDPTWNVDADALQLELAILNLAFNARDAMPQGGTLTVSAERRQGTDVGLPPGDYVAVTLADTGMGMSEEVRQRALEPFFTTKDIGQGTGMGLSMAYGVVRQSGGTLTIASAPGEGTAITLYLRIAEGQPERDHDGDRNSEAPVSLKGCRILLVDDDAQVRATLVDMLEAARAEVRQASNGAEALARLEEERPGLLIVDFAMPGMSGAEVARHARALSPRLPILIVTGFAESAEIDALADIDVAVLRKPFESDELVRRAGELLGAH